MEKQTFRFLHVAIASALVAISSSSAWAGTSFRLNSKSPIAPKRAASFNGYVFGYGGVVFGSSWENTGAFDLDPGWQDHCPDQALADPLFDPLNIPMDWDTENGWSFGGGIGKYSGLFGGSRFELEGTYLSNEVNRLTYAGFELPANFDIKTKAVMVNYLKEVPFGSATGYFGGGIGWGWTTMDGDIDTIQYGSTDDGFAWQLIVGIDIPVTERLALFTQYRYLVLDDCSFTTDFGDFTNTTDDNPSSHSLLIGARVSF